ncbi:Uncharacterised protein [Mycobacterium tuberculosis]|uniref:Uncharacterized protein n=1 Tax=Mycobacterium tuberculosis TaxID=1773 RepID=A0A0U0UPU1_MYCTX|nr:hypothetical protein CAB90_01978 [Mycobacterium tuberculosis]COV38389.1 Uncharacterised protein [Mycobacterium tuberculosis]COV50189.1 Uncharacterised protein [Mycobacterium tuberculosis]COW85037.1 Uncharacterised protein [Mycobacterium tuberculosis]COX45741.1 Uncharacterised protein [Mycobacterium tuberculosis]
MPEPVRLELDLAQLINDHRPNLRGAHPLFVLVLAAFNVVRLEHLTVGLGNYRLDIGTPHANFQRCERVGKQLRANVVDAVY